MSKQHTLYKNTLPGSLYTYYITELTEEEVNTHDDFNELRNATEYDHLQIRISSSGGFIRTGQMLINIIDDIFSDRCYTIIENEAVSMAAVIFCKGVERIVYPHSLIMFHNYSAGYYGKGNEINAWHEAFYPMALNYLKTHSVGLSEDEVIRLSRGEDFWFNAEQMLKRGIATHILIDGTKLTAKEYFERVEDESITS